MPEKNNPELSEIGMRFSKFLKEKRTVLGLTLREFALFIYEDENKNGYLSKLENGKREPNLETMSYILKRLNSSIEFIEH
ncbi:Helix-turn-helix [Tenacibaculum sp. MAR_2009_124]|uniref:helix-turn-helix domain-containing protein n=1 Tax=Tenacibaculum sp. MAR_2009_124 TaxID=1250059 RepID=UPI00089B87D1|nr:helix-turn-helix transcriptional regulator [Tenacibaculum sp. MAR_2009_124]SED12103.1 Helix-turn-helix [Tenacibaculum sp. MAR_2009_124]